MTIRPQAAFTAPGLCHNLDVTGSPHAGTVVFKPDGTAQVPLSLGDVLGSETVVGVTDEDYLTTLVDATLCALARLRMAHEDVPGCAA